MFCEMAAYAKSRGRMVDQLLDEAFAGLGYFEEKNASIYFEGAEGADKIARLLESYANNPPKEIASSKVTGITDFEKETIRDVEGDVIPNRRCRSSSWKTKRESRCAVPAPNRRSSITFSRSGDPTAENSAMNNWPGSSASRGRLDAVWAFIEKDAHARLKG